MRLRAPCLVLLTALIGCDGQIEIRGIPPVGGTGGSGSGGGAGSGTGGAGAGGVVIDPTCDVSQYQGITLPDIEAAFAQNVYPKFVSAQSGCISCHATNSGRQFKVWAGMTG
ncbi:MAG: hypothetical protein H6Q89_5014, partial [Myxococcaceae bacterium]|nr:hypothetical protein [Myxococcaceae bacterium]